MREIKIKKNHPDAVIPRYGRSGDGAFDLTAVSYEFKDGRHVYDIGLAFEIPYGFVGLVFPRSSICKYDLRLTNGVGVVDSNFRGNVKAIFENDCFHIQVGMRTKINTEPKQIYKVGDRVAQMMILPYPEISFIQVDELSDSNRGTSGWGSSGQ
jgi:dUTP pyrophosphatase